MTVILSAVDCPTPILARTRNAKACKAKAAAGGWVTSCTYAVADIEGPVQTILLRVQRGPVRLAACWSGALGVVDKQGRPAGLGFDGAWRKDASGTKRITYTQFSHYLGDPSAEPPPGPAMAKKDADEQGLMVHAIGMIAEIGASFVRVQPPGQCDGHVMQGPPFGRQSCTNAPEPGTSWCAGPCGRE